MNAREMAAGRRERVRAGGAVNRAQPSAFGVEENARAVLLCEHETSGRGVRWRLNERFTTADRPDAFAANELDDARLCRYGPDV
jgi:hypothetical protein